MVRNFLGIITASIIVFFVLNAVINPKGYEEGYLLIGLILISLQVSFLTAVIIRKKQP